MANIEVVQPGPNPAPSEEPVEAIPLSQREYRQELRGQRGRTVDARDMFSQIRSIGRLQRRIESGRAQSTAHARLNRLYDELATMRFDTRRGVRPSLASLNGLRDELARIRPREPHRRAALSMAIGNVDEALVPALARRAPPPPSRQAPHALRRPVDAEVVVNRSRSAIGVPDSVSRTTRGGFNGAVAGAGFGVGSALGTTLSTTVLAGTPYAALAPVLGGIGGGIYGGRLGQDRGFTRVPLRAGALAAAAYLVPGARTAIAVSAAGGALMNALRPGS